MNHLFSYHAIKYEIVLRMYALCVWTGWVIGGWNEQTIIKEMKEEKKNTKHLFLLSIPSFWFTRSINRSMLLNSIIILVFRCFKNVIICENRANVADIFGIICRYWEHDMTFNDIWKLFLNRTTFLIPFLRQNHFVQ